MLTTRRRLAWVSSLLARSPRCTHRISRRVSASALDARRPRRCAAAARWPSSIELGQPPLVVAGEQVDLADLPQVHAHAVGRHALRARRGPPDAGAGGAG